MKKLLMGTILLCSITLVGCQKSTSITTTESTNNLTGTISGEENKFITTSFQECIDAGFPIMESYPRQCNNGETTFTEEIEITTGENQNMSGKDLNITGNINTGLNDIIETGNINTGSKETGNDNSALESKIKAMLERRTQQDNTIETTNQETPNTGSENITEDDIEALENIIDEIISK